MLRRALAKKPKLAALANNILNKYIEHDYAGTNTSNVDQNLVAAAPLPGQKTTTGVAGPIPPGEADWYFAHPIS